MSLYFYKTSFTILLTILLFACGGGGDSTESRPTRSQISFEDLSTTTLEFDENTPIVLSLNVENPDNVPLTFEWDINLRSGLPPINFSGQNTDTIRFTAPEVESSALISVNVQISTADGTRLIGPSNSRASIRIINTTPIPPFDLVTNNNIIQGLPQVESIDLSSLSQQGTWSIRLFDFDGIDRFNGQTGIVFTQRQDDDSQEMTLCNATNSSDFETFILNSALPRFEVPQQQVCGSNPIATRLFQNENTITVESRCGDILTTASTYTQLSDQIVTNYGQIDVNFDSSTPLNTNENVCFFTSKSIIEQPPLSRVAFSSIGITTFYQDELILFNIAVDSVSNFSTNRIDGLFANSGQTFFNLLSPALPSLNDVAANDGRITIRSQEVDHIEGSFRAEIPTGVETSENVEGSFFFRID